MSFQRVAIAGTLIVCSALGTTPTLAADPDRGEDLAWHHRCMTCHGETGMTSDARYPHLAGQPALYLEARLKYFRAEEEPLNQMNGQARPLSDDEIADLAAYFSAQRR